MADYPSYLPCPSWEYAQQVDTFQRRTPMDCGWVRQRRRYFSAHTAIELSFVLPTEDFALWQDFMDANGYNSWFNIDLDDYGSGKETTSVRLTSSTMYDYSKFDKIQVTVSAEVQQ
ncbi:MAG: hypothetical protein OEU55_16495 [Desulfobacterales bacterium]|jgi:hypothetical protein|nr:hypothetical protein [Desulfobacterales bacterium]